MRLLLPTNFPHSRLVRNLTRPLPSTILTCCLAADNTACLSIFFPQQFEMFSAIKHQLCYYELPKWSLRTLHIHVGSMPIFARLSNGASPVACWTRKNATTSLANSPRPAV
ncbi:unnamed protein product [Periconia digitata]|uniref:Uncharacterized protein n=1 Tax=Periconia digitata TaxID=1303443 RepID=A0A9W4U346_9PLEO|nr:unnamed protein product [Periconia digitata]